MAINIDLSGKLALVTGVTSGIGAGAAGMFARAGADVVGCARAASGSVPAATFVQSVVKENVRALYVKTDVTVLEDLERLVETVVRKFRRIDVLVSNAGENVFEGLASCSEERWEHNLNLNLSSHWRLARLCRPYLEQARGAIVVMTSNQAYTTMPGFFPYNVAKTALTGLVRAMAIEWGPLIRTVGLAPGFIDTPANDAWFKTFPDPSAERKRTLELHPVKRIGTVEEVGAWCVFLASPWAAFASGTTYLIDGGRSVVMQDS